VTGVNSKPAKKKFVDVRGYWHFLRNSSESHLQLFKIANILQRVVNTSDDVLEQFEGQKFSRELTDNNKR
jgi:hypothetical protein